MTDTSDERGTRDLEAYLAKTERKSLGDRAVAAGGLTLALGAALFPWYVFFNPGAFGVKPIGLDSERELPERPARSVVSVSPLAIPDRRDASAPAEPFDAISTATIPLAGQAEDDRPPAPQAQPVQPFPGATFRLLHVANGRALIEDGRDIYVVRIGSALPDDSHVARLERRQDGWVIVTSNGDVIGR